MTNQHQDWMIIALEEAKKAMEVGEIPVASVLVAGNYELGRGQTQVKRRGSIAAHGELFALLEAKEKVFTADRPLVIYTTLEPCLMCLGACIQTGVDEVVFGMLARPDGGSRFAEQIRQSGQNVPKITAGILEEEEVQLMREFFTRYPDSPAIPYVRELLAQYD